jgi:hypothetical protein
MLYAYWWVSSPTHKKISIRNKNSLWEKMHKELTVQVSDTTMLNENQLLVTKSFSIAVS